MNKDEEIIADELIFIDTETISEDELLEGDNYEESGE